jgi:hypothetical protein
MFETKGVQGDVQDFLFAGTKQDFQQGVPAQDETLPPESVLLAFIFSNYSGE